MFRISVFVFTIVLCAVAVRGYACAATEFCAATVRLDAQSAQPETVRDLTLWSQAPHRLSGQLQFFTANGWYAVDLAAFELRQTQETWRSSGFAYPVSDWSAHVRVTFPSNVDVGAVVFAPRSGGSCLAYVKPQKGAGAPLWSITSESAARPVAMDASSIPPPPGRTDCRQPFAEATMTEPVPPQFPQRFLDRGFDRSGALLSVAIDARGALQDAWFLSPSGFYEIDQSAMRAAHLSGYRAATLFCGPAPGVYTYQTTFHAN